MRKRKSPVSDLDKVEPFKAWLTRMGAEVLAPTNSYEVVRFRGNGKTSVIYRNDAGRRWSFQNDALDAWNAFERNDVYRLNTATPRLRSDRLLPIDRAIAERDGDLCFYCARTFDDIGPKRRTREHLVSITHGGPNHIANMFHAHDDCNQAAGHLSAPEKIRLRDKNRRGRGMSLLARAYDRLFGGEADVPLMQDMQDFLNTNPAGELPNV